MGSDTYYLIECLFSREKIKAHGIEHNIQLSSDHSSRLAVLKAGKTSPELHLGDKTELWHGSYMRLDPMPSLISINGDGIFIDLSAIKSPTSFSVPSCDCSPIAIRDDKNNLGLLHISTETLSFHKTAKNHNGNPDRIPLLHKFFALMSAKNCFINMGPCINQCCYEFGRNDAELLKQQTEILYPGIEYLDEFHQDRHGNQDKVYLDFPGIIKNALISMGVDKHRINLWECACTFCGTVPETNGLWHSSRRSGHKKDRNWSSWNVRFSRNKKDCYI